VRVRVASFAAVASAALVVLAASGCGTGGYTSEGSQGAGKELFSQQCGTCHVLADAGTAGTVGPNLDDAFAQARTDGMTSDTFTQVVAGQIRFPITETSTGAPGMPAVDDTLPSCDDVEGDGFCVDDQDQAVSDIAAYVGSVAGTGVTAEAPTDGKEIFTTSCGGCHQLADAGTDGTVGPNLDESMPSRALVTDRVTNGKGVMPSFKESLDPAQIEAVAEYVSSAAGP
jgi:cbb3-type cytochrome c oxidase subunit III